MRIFGSESMNKMLEKLGLRDGESIDHPWINKALERAQQKVEARNFDIRKTLIKFDNVLNDQRHVIFSQRKLAMNNDQIFKYSDDFLDEITTDIFKLKSKKISNPKNNEFENRVIALMGKNLDQSELQNLINKSELDFKSKIFENFKKMRDERIKLLGNSGASEIEKRIFLQSIDFNWKSHIQYLEQLRQVIGLRSYGQRDPLIEYKKEAFGLFENLLNKLKLDYISVLANLKIVNETKEETKEKSRKENTITAEKKISRNEPCPCGSGKKFKKCCGVL